MEAIDETLRVEDDEGNVEGDFYCGRCAGTGQFITGSMNGKPTGPGGICFRCEGKGYHNQADRRRNYGYELKGRKIYL